MSQIKNTSIIGGSGQQGTPILKALVSSKNFTITAITRSDSPSTFPPEVQVTRGDYTDSFLASALELQDALIIILGVTAPKDLQSRVIKAAAVASVPWILPCEFGPDGASREMMDGLHIWRRRRRREMRLRRGGKAVGWGLFVASGLTWYVHYSSHTCALYYVS